jgi:hypothetical protein
MNDATQLHGQREPAGWAKTPGIEEIFSAALAGVDLTSIAYESQTSCLTLQFANGYGLRIIVAPGERSLTLLCPDRPEFGV